MIPATEMNDSENIGNINESDKNDLFKLNAPPEFVKRVNVGARCS